MKESTRGVGKGRRFKNNTEEDRRHAGGKNEKEIEKGEKKRKDDRGIGQHCFSYHCVLGD